MESILKTSFIAILLSSSWGLASDLASIKTHETRLTQTLDFKTKEISKLSNQLEKLSEKISSLKTQQNKNPGIFQNMRLERFLKEAKEVSDRLDQSKLGAEMIQTELKEVRLAHIDLLDHEITLQSSLANEKGQKIEERKHAAQVINRLIDQRARLVQIPKTIPVPLTASLLQKSTTPEDHADRVNAIRDFEKRLDREATTLVAEISQLKKQNFVRSEVSHLLDEESLFSEQNFVRGGIARTAKTDSPAGIPNTAVTNAKDPNPNPTIPVGDGAANPLTPDSLNLKSPSVGVIDVPIPVNSPTEALSAQAPLSTSHEEGTLESRKEQTEMLLRLANQLGIEPKEVQTLVTLLKPEQKVTHLHWLENRLLATRTVMKRLHELASNLEQTPTP